MWKRSIRKAVLLSLLSIGIGGLFGCSKSPTDTAHTTNDITAVAISYSGMNRSSNYSFCLRSDSNEWLLDAECFIQDKEVERALSGCPVTAEEVDECMTVLMDNDTIGCVKKHKSMDFLHTLFNVSDDENESIVLTFSDGTQCAASISQPTLEAFFYSLAEKYAQSENS